MARATPKRAARILVVDDDPGLLRLLTIRLRSEKYEVEPADNAAKALSVIAGFRPDLVVTDLRMAQMDGLALLKELKRRWPSLNVILLTAHGTIPDAVRATQSGAFAFLTKPVEKEQLLAEVRRALKTSGFAATTDDWTAEFVTRSPLVENVLASARLAATSDAPVLITGEPGSGREPLARAIHRGSARRDGPLVDLDCSDLEADPEGQRRLAEAIDQAVGGTLLLHEVPELPAPLQAELLAGLERPASPPRLIATADALPETTAADARISPALIDRLAGVHLHMPPLSKRREDIPLLAAEALEEVARESAQEPKTCAPEAIEFLAAAEWPGNLRQLRAVLREASVLAPGPVVTAELVQQAMGATTQVPSFDEARDEFTRNYLVQLLKVTRGNVSQAARLARRNRTDFYKLLTRYAVVPEEFK
jgi:two-component system, NtrC family, response regulator GlrR